MKMTAIICRLCSKESLNCLDIFSNVFDNQICSVINICVGINIKEEDDITRFICGQCFYLVKAFSELRTAAIENDRRFKAELESKLKLSENLIKNNESYVIQKCTTDGPENINKIRINKTYGNKNIENKNTENKRTKVKTTETKTVENETIEKKRTKNKNTENKTLETENKVDSKNIENNTKEIRNENEEKTTVEPLSIKIKPLSDENKIITTPKQNGNITEQQFMSGIDLLKSKSIKNPKAKRKTNIRIHPSLRKIKILYPYLRLPKKCCKWNFDPVVVVNNKIVEDWIERNKPKDIFTVKPTENNQLGLTFNKMPADFQYLLNEFENDILDTESIMSETKSDDSFSPSSSETDDEDDMSYPPINKSRENRSRKRSNDSKGKSSSSKKKRKDTEKKTGDLLIDAEHLAEMRKRILQRLLPEKTIEPNPIVVEKTIEPNPIVVEKTIEPNPIVNEKTIEPNPIIDETQQTVEDDLLVETSHVSKAFICTTCNAVYYSQRSLKDHVKRHQSNQRCQECPETFASIEDLIKHISETHYTPTIQRSIAKKSTSKSPKPDRLPIENLNVLKDIANNQNKTDEKEIIISSDEEEDIRKKVEPSENKIKSPISQVPPPNEDAYLKTVINKYINRKVTNTNLEPYTCNIKPSLLEVAGVTLPDLDRLLDRTFIPVEFIPRTDTPNITVKYNFNTAQRTKPKNSSYTWSDSQAIDAQNTTNFSVLEKLLKEKMKQEKEKVYTIPIEDNSTPKTLSATPVVTNTITKSNTITTPNTVTIPNTITIPNTNTIITPNTISKTNIITKPNTITIPNTIPTPNTITPNSTIVKPTTPPISSVSKTVTQYVPSVPPPLYISTNTLPRVTVYQPQQILPKPPQNTQTPTNSTSVIQKGSPNGIQKPLIYEKKLIFHPDKTKTVFIPQQKPQDSKSVTTSQNIIPPTNSLLKSNLTSQTVTTATKAVSNSVVYNPNPNILVNSAQPTYSTSQQNGLTNFIFLAQNDQPNINVQNIFHIVPNGTNTGVPTPVLVPNSVANISEIPPEQPVVPNKPLIRIKHISELTAKSVEVNTIDRNLLQNNYAQTVSNYVSTYSSIQNQNTQDEYLQI